MIILRIKSFATPLPQQNPQQPNSPQSPNPKPGQILIEQMKTEREAMKNMRKRQEMEAIIVLVILIFIRVSLFPLLRFR